VKTLVAGIGNIFNSDDGFGVEVVRRLLARPAPSVVVGDVQIEDFGIRGIHLALELLEGYDLLVLVDAIAREGEPAGTLFVLEPTANNDDDDIAGSLHEDGAGRSVDAHQLDPVALLRQVAAMGGSIGRVFVVGCVPADLDDGIGLSRPVAASVEPAVRMVEELLAEQVLAEQVLGDHVLADQSLARK